MNLFLVPVRLDRLPRWNPKRIKFRRSTALHEMEFSDVASSGQCNELDKAIAEPIGFASSPQGLLAAKRAARTCAVLLLFPVHSPYRVPLLRFRLEMRT